MGNDHFKFCESKNILNLRNVLRFCMVRWSTSESFYSAVREELETSLNRLPLTQQEKT